MRQIRGFKAVQKNQESRISFSISCSNYLILTLSLVRNQWVVFSTGVNFSRCTVFSERPIPIYPSVS